MLLSRIYLIILTYIFHLSYAQTIGTLESLTFDEITTEQIDAYTTQQIGWIKMYSCIQASGSYTYYHTSELLKLQYYAISIKFVPPGSKTNSNYDNYAVVAKPCSNPVKALNHGKEISFVINEGTEAFLEQANTDFWIGTTTAKARLTNTCNNNAAPLREFNSSIYQACNNNNGLHVYPAGNQCDWDDQNILSDDMEIYFGFDVNKTEYCNTPYRQIINFATNYCVNEKSRPPTYDPTLFRFDTCDETNDNQLWEIADVTNEWFRLKNKKSTCCIEMTTTAYVTIPDGTEFGCNECKDVNTDSQYFKINSDDGTSFRLRNKLTDICMFQATDGRFGMSDCWTYPDQRWTWKIISNAPTTYPTNEPTWFPTNQPTFHPTTNPTSEPSTEPTTEPTYIPTRNPIISSNPSVSPSKMPTKVPTKIPTKIPTKRPTTTSTTTTLEPTINPISTTDEDATESGKSTEKDTGMDNVMVILILLIGVVFICMICMIFVYFCYGRKSNEDNIAQGSEFEGNGTELDLGVTSPTNLQSVASISLSEQKQTDVTGAKMNDASFIGVQTAHNAMNNQMNAAMDWNGNVMNNQMVNPMMAMHQGVMSMPNVYNMGGMNANYGVDQNLSMTDMNAMAIQMARMQQNLGINNNMQQFYMNQMDTNTIEPGGEPVAQPGAEPGVEPQNQHLHIQSMPNMMPLPPSPEVAQNH